MDFFLANLLIVLLIFLLFGLTLPKNDQELGYFSGKILLPKISEKLGVDSKQSNVLDYFCLMLLMMGAIKVLDHINGEDSGGMM
jgi:hypothetical protein